MKEGLYYRDIRTGEILKCKIFSPSCHVFINRNNVHIMRARYDVYQRITNKSEIEEFESNRENKTRKDVREDIILGLDNIMKFNIIYEWKYRGDYLKYEI